MGMNSRRAIATLVMACAACSAARAAESSALHISLANGFDVVCDHREDAGDRVRLYLQPGNESFMEIAKVEIVSEQVGPSSRETDTASPQVPAIASTLKKGISPDPTAQQLRGMMSRAGEQHNLDVDLLESVVRAESRGDTHAVSHAGARGLMQLMPATAAQMGVADSFHPEENINGGTAYLDGLLVRYHDDIALALAAYNAGPAAVDRYHGIPPYRETRAYVARVIHEFNRRKSLAARASGLAALHAAHNPGLGTVESRTP